MQKFLFVCFRVLLFFPPPPSSVSTTERQLLHFQPPDCKKDLVLSLQHCEYTVVSTNSEKAMETVHIS